MKLIVTKLHPRFSEHRLGAQYEITIEGQEQWAALVGGEDMDPKEAEKLVNWFAASLLMMQTLEEVDKTFRQISNQKTHIDTPTWNRVKRIWKTVSSIVRTLPPSA
jgi:hypothetical protein